MRTSRIIGHRGACGHAPENTLASIRKAAELGATWVEFDTMLSADKQVVIIHDDTLQRTTGSEGEVSKTTWADLSKLDAGKWFSEEFAGETIPLFRNVIDLMTDLNLNAVVEIKPSRGQDEETARRTLEVLRECWPASRPLPLISSFNKKALKAAFTNEPDIPRALNIVGSLAGWREEMVRLDCCALHCLHDLIDQTTASEIIAAGYDLRCFTVNNPDRAEVLFGWGVQAIFTDFPDRFIDSKR